jgi:hypothetical protein
MASRAMPRRQAAVQLTKPRAGAIAADYSSPIDSLFDDLRIKNRRQRTIFWTTAMTAPAPLPAV